MIFSFVRFYFTQPVQGISFLMAFLFIKELDCEVFKNINCKNLPSLRRNIVYQFLYELLIVFIPLFTIPYVSRVLGAENIGLFSYTYAVANYFVLFANLGIKNYGSRTIAMVRNNKEELNRNFSEILSIHIIFQ